MPHLTTKRYLISPSPPVWPQHTSPGIRAIMTIFALRTLDHTLNERQNALSRIRTPRMCEARLDSRNGGRREDSQAQTKSADTDYADNNPGLPSKDGASHHFPRAAESRMIDACFVFTFFVLCGDEKHVRRMYCYCLLRPECKL